MSSFETAATRMWFPRRGAAPRRRQARVSSNGVGPMRSRIRAAFCALLCLLLGAAATAQTDAARPIADAHSLDAYFALFAPDSNVPWKPATVRLETYTSAPVDLTVYAVDPSDVLTAGGNARPRAVNTARLHLLAHWQFTPPGGFQFQSNEV